MNDIRGRVVTEAEVAVDLGFADVHELRRWSTAQGQVIMGLREELGVAKSDASRFCWHGMRMIGILQRILPMLQLMRRSNAAGTQIVVTDFGELDKLILAIGVVCNTAVDWDNVLVDWLESTPDSDYSI